MASSPDEDIDLLDQAKMEALKKLVRAVNAAETLGSDGPVTAMSNHIAECEWEFVLAYRNYQQAITKLTG